MANGIRTGDPRGFNKGRNLKFRVGSRVRHTPKRCGNNNKNEDNSVAFQPGQCTSPQLHPCHRLFDYSRYLTPGCRYYTITQEDFHGAFQKLLERYNKCIASKGFMCVLSRRKKFGNLFNDPRIYISILFCSYLSIYLSI